MASPAPELPSSESRVRSTLRRLLPILPIALLVLAGVTLHRELHGFRWHDVWLSLEALRVPRLAVALLLVALNYLCLTLYDVLALRHLGKALPYPRVGFASFIGYALGHNIGLAFLSGGSVRLRLYGAWGLTGVDVAQVMGFNGLTFWVGVFTVGGTALLLGPGGVASPVPLPPWVGALMLLAVAGYLALCAKGTRAISVRGLSFRLPSLRIALGQLVVSSLDWALAAAIFALLLPEGAGLSFGGATALFVLAQLAGLISQVPGGAGVFETVVVTSLSGRVPAPALLGSLLVYRSFYYLLPFAVATLWLAAVEVVQRRAPIAGAVRKAHASFAPVVPTVAAIGALLAGAVLLFSGATPTVPARLDWLQRLLPLPFVELSHLLGSAIGMALVLLARGLQRRLDGAYLLAISLLAAGALFSLLKGVDYEEATLLSILALGLTPFRAQFYRRTSLLSEPFGASWTIAALVVFAASLWLGHFSYEHVEYRRELWWQFTFEGDAPRFLRASVAATLLAIGFGTAHLLRPARPEPRLPTEADFARARPLISQSPDTAAYLALVGDKELLFDERGEAFLMYGISGRSWVCMGDPIGPPDAATELAWQFRGLVDRHHGWTCFYQVAAAQLPRYLDLGLALLKLGEEATVSLTDFDLEGAERRGLRQGHRRLEREGFSLELVPPPEVPARVALLKELSDAWLAEKSTREKGFSLGYFEPRYLGEGPVALVRQHERVVAFANLWAPSRKDELSIDLMRYRPDCPRGVMDYLFVALMLWGKAEGYGRFNLGMAPFSGFEDRTLAPLWNRVGAFLFRHGEHFYNFQGLRQYKEKFHPQWAPRYLAAPGGLQLPIVLTNIAALVSRGVGGVVSR